MVVSHIRRKHMMTALQIGESSFKKTSTRDKLLMTSNKSNNELR